MKIFENQSIWKKIVIAILIVMGFQFCFSTPVRAEDEGLGDILLNPIMALLVTFGDRNIKSYTSRSYGTKYNGNKNRPGRRNIGKNR